MSFHHFNCFYDLYILNNFNQILLAFWRTISRPQNDVDVQKRTTILYSGGNDHINELQNFPLKASAMEWVLFYGFHYFLWFYTYFIVRFNSFFIIRAKISHSRLLLSGQMISDWQQYKNNGGCTRLTHPNLFQQIFHQLGTANPKDIKYKER